MRDHTSEVRSWIALIIPTVSLLAAAHVGGKLYYGSLERSCGSRIGEHALREVTQLLARLNEATLPLEEVCVTRAGTAPSTENERASANERVDITGRVLLSCTETQTAPSLLNNNDDDEDEDTFAVALFFFADAHPHRRPSASPRHTRTRHLHLSFLPSLGYDCVRLYELHSALQCHPDVTVPSWANCCAHDVWCLLCGQVKATLAPQRLCQEQHATSAHDTVHDGLDHRATVQNALAVARLLHRAPPPRHIGVCSHLPHDSVDRCEEEIDMKPKTPVSCSTGSSSSCPIPTSACAIAVDRLHGGVSASPWRVLWRWSHTLLSAVPMHWRRTLAHTVTQAPFSSYFTTHEYTCHTRRTCSVCMSLLIMLMLLVTDGTFPAPALRRTLAVLRRGLWGLYKSIGSLLAAAYLSSPCYDTVDTTAWLMSTLEAYWARRDDDDDPRMKSSDLALTWLASLCSAALFITPHMYAAAVSWCWRACADVTHTVLYAVAETKVTCWLHADRGRRACRTAVALSRLDFVDCPDWLVPTLTLSALTELHRWGLEDGCRLLRTSVQPVRLLYAVSAASLSSGGALAAGWVVAMMLRRVERVWMRGARWEAVRKRVTAHGGRGREGERGEVHVNRTGLTRTYTKDVTQDTKRGLDDCGDDNHYPRYYSLCLLLGQCSESSTSLHRLAAAMRWPVTPRLVRRVSQDACSHVARCVRRRAHVDDHRVVGHDTHTVAALLQQTHDALFDCPNTDDDDEEEQAAQEATCRQAGEACEEQWGEYVEEAVLQLLAGLRLLPVLTWMTLAAWQTSSSYASSLTAGWSPMHAVVSEGPAAVLRAWEAFCVLAGMLVQDVANSRRHHTLATSFFTHSTRSSSRWRRAVRGWAAVGQSWWDFHVWSPPTLPEEWGWCTDGDRRLSSPWRWDVAVMRRCGWAAEDSSESSEASRAYHAALTRLHRLSTAIRTNQTQAPLLPMNELRVEKEELRTKGVACEPRGCAAQPVRTRLSCTVDGRPWQDCSPESLLDVGPWHVELREVSFRYPRCHVSSSSSSSASLWALRHVTLNCRPGTLTGIMGYSGSGKTTLLLLLTRMYAVTTGAVYVNGRPIECFAPRALRRRIAHAWQAASPAMRFVLECDVASNIALGDAGHATPDTITWALSTAQALDFVRARRPPPVPGTRLLREDGVGVSLHDGSSFSGGEWERLSVARAVAAGRRGGVGLCLLDECTNALDSVTEAAMMRGVRSLRTATASAPTVIMTAHRPASLATAEEIVVLCRGRVVQRGTWQELCASPPSSHFHALHRTSTEE